MTTILKLFMIILHSFISTESLKYYSVHTQFILAAFQGLDRKKNKKTKNHMTLGKCWMVQK